MFTVLSFQFLAGTYMHTCDCNSPPPWEKKKSINLSSCVSPLETCSQKMMSSLKKPVKPPNVFLLQFTIALWAERRMRAANFLGLL